MNKALPLLALLVPLAFPASRAVADVPARPAASKIVVRATLESYSPETKTITYRAANGRYSATRIGTRRYRLRGTIDGRRLRGTIRTRQAPSRDRYIARGRGRLGDRSVRISGGGPNTLRTATLVLR